MNHLKEIQKLLIGRPVSHVWRGIGSALLIEFGTLTNRIRPSGISGKNPKGEITILIEWSWRIEGPRSILLGSWSSDGKWLKAFKGLLHARVTDVSVFSTLPELQIVLSNGKRVSSFMTAEGQPRWIINSRIHAPRSWKVQRGIITLTKETIFS